MSLTKSVNSFNQSINNFFTFFGEQLKNFKQLETPEQIAFGCIGLGLVLIILAIILFVF